MGKDQIIWGILRLCMGWLFLWPFFDKVFGLGFATAAGKGWIDGGSPTFGFLNFAVKGPFAEFYQGVAGHPVVDWLFMLGLLFIGVAFLLGIAVKLAGYYAVLMFLLMYTAGFIWPEHNPFLDEHLVYAIVVLGLTFVNSGHWLGLGKWWSNLPLVKDYSILR